MLSPRQTCLSSALQQIWQHNPDEKIVIFATYLGTVEAIKRQLDAVFPVRVLMLLKGAIMALKPLHRNVFDVKTDLKY